MSASSRKVSAVPRTFSTRRSDLLPRAAPLRELATSGCSTANTKNVTPHSVSGRVVKISTSSPVSSIVNVTVAPSERPIQFRCMVRTRSGQSVSSSMSSSSRWA